MLASCTVDSSAIRPESDVAPGHDVGVDTSTLDAMRDTAARDTTVPSRPDGGPADATTPMDGASPDAAPDTGTASDTSTPPDTIAPPDASIPLNCGDRTLDRGESCDDGNNTSGDGCSAVCETESSFDDCPGARLVIGLGRQSYRGSNAGAASTQTCSSGRGRGPDAVYTIAPNYTGRLNIRVTSPFDAVLMTKSACPGAVQFFCEDSWYGGSTEQVTGGVSAGTEYMVIVSGYGSSDTGDFELVFRGSSP